jgi:hypothetical protein
MRRLRSPTGRGRLGRWRRRCVIEPGGQGAASVEHVALSDLPPGA